MMMKFNRILLGAAALFAMFSAFEANAQTTDTRNLNVSATVPTVCLIDSAATINMAFNLSDLATRGADYIVDVTLDWRCSATVPVVVDLGGTTATARTMAGPNPLKPLPYTLTDDVDVLWGDDTNGATSRALTGAGMGIPAQQNTIIRGTIALTDAQAADVGAYSDTVLISFTY
jgi:spore coat protein U-like protein